MNSLECPFYFCAVRSICVGVNTSSNCRNGVYHVQIVLDDVTNPRVYSNEQMTQGNSVFLRDVVLSPNQTHLYALTTQRVCVHFALHLTVC